jgi:hypothetical protein
MINRLQTYWPYLLVTALIMAPLWLPGYIFTLDLVFTPTMPAPTALSPDYLWELLLHGLSRIIPSWLIEKSILTAIPLLAAIGMHRLLQLLRSFVPAMALQWHAGLYGGALLFAINPFTYSRFMAGQYAVLLGYAALPWFAWAVLQCVRQPSLKRGIGLGGLAALVGIVSVHTVGLLAVLACCFGLYGLTMPDAKRRAILAAAVAGLVTCFIVSSDWLVPLVAGQGGTADTIRSFDSEHAAAFATLGTSVPLKIINVLSLQGFWAEGRELYRLPQDQLPLWGTVRLVWWVIVGVGLVALWKHSRRLTALIATVGAVGLIAAIGTAQPLLTAIGYREPHKFAGLVALAAAMATAFGIARLAHRAAKHSDIRGYAVTSALLAVILLLTAPMYGGFGGQLQARHYPAEWKALNGWLNRQPAGKAIFVPWHQYLGLGFAGRTIANPAPHYFDREVVVSQDPELGNIAAPTDATQQTARSLFHSRSKAPRPAAALAEAGIAYIIVDSSYEPGRYDYLQKDPALKSVWHNQSLMVYRNTLYKD